MSAKLFAIALPLAFFVIVAGAFTRLSDAGLGCPDWPGCYGKFLGAPSADEAATHSPDKPFDSRKAWIEIGHRIVAGLLGGLLFVAAMFARREKSRQGAAFTLVLLVLLQALLGMLTVTENLRPVIVVAHLLGGMLILFFLVFVTTRKPLKATAVRYLHSWGVAAALFLFLQILLGGWVSANYAGLACPDFPLCQGGLLPPTTDFSGFLLSRELHLSADGSPLNAAALATIHWLHRLGALATTFVIGGFSVALMRSGKVGAGIGLLVFLFVQIALGIAAVLLQLPLAVALAHNAVAALLTVNVAVLLAKIRMSKGTGKHSP